MASELLEHYLSDSTRRHPAPAGAFTGAAGGAPCGDLVRVSIELAGGRIASASFAAEGCAASRAAGAAVAELAEGEPVLGAAMIGRREISEALGELGPQGMHGADLAADALHRALAAAGSSGEELAPPPDAGERTLVAMSGGVDSAVAAVLERERGADVVAVTLKLWQDRRTDGERSCCSPEAVLGARALAHSLGVPHLTLDLEEDFRHAVVGGFVAGYRAGQTPNPCVLCNGELRIAAMIGLAERVGASVLATGHYARIADDGTGPLLAPAADPAKDQSYMLTGLAPALLHRLRFPLAELRKPEVRDIATDHALPAAGRAESQDLCFLAGQGKRAFLRRHGGLADREGDLIDRSGRRVGRHPGHQHFTIGQRRGIGIGGREPLYVLRTDADANTVTVGTRGELATRAIALRDATLHRDADRIDRVRLRYHAPAIRCRVEESAGVGTHDRLTLILDEPVDGAAPGQAACLMAGGMIVGHGTITAGLDSTAAIEQATS